MLMPKRVHPFDHGRADIEPLPLQDVVYPTAFNATFHTGRFTTTPMKRTSWSRHTELGTHPSGQTDNTHPSLPSNWYYDCESQTLTQATRQPQTIIRLLRACPPPHIVSMPFPKLPRTPHNQHSTYLTQYTPHLTTATNVNIHASI